MSTRPVQCVDGKKDLVTLRRVYGTVNYARSLTPQFGQCLGPLKAVPRYLVQAGQHQFLSEKIVAPTTSISTAGRPYLTGTPKTVPASAFIESRMKSRVGKRNRARMF
jgi:hypothetical protein